MALPKKVQQKDKIQKAIDVLDSISQTSVKKTGRPRTVLTEREKISLYINGDVLFRLEQVLAHKKYEARQNGQRIDRSLLIEDAITRWIEEEEKQLAV